MRLYVAYSLSVGYLIRLGYLIYLINNYFSCPRNVLSTQKAVSKAPPGEFRIIKSVRATL